MYIERNTLYIVNRCWGMERTWNREVTMSVEGDLSPTLRMLYYQYNPYILHGDLF